MKNFITGLITAGVVVYVALIYHSTGLLYCAVWIVCFLLLLLGFHLLFFRKLRFSFDKITETVASGEQMTLAVLAQNRCFLPSGRIRIVVEAYHVLNDTTGEIIIDCMLPGGLQRRSAQPIRIRGEWTPSYPGGVYFRLVSVRHYDYFGFTSIGVSRRNLDQSEVLAVLPVYHEIGISAGVKYHTQHLEQEGDDSTSMERIHRKYQRFENTVRVIVCTIYIGNYRRSGMRLWCTNLFLSRILCRLFIWHR